MQLSARALEGFYYLPQGDNLLLIHRIFHNTFESASSLELPLGIPKQKTSFQVLIKNQCPSHRGHKKLRTHPPGLRKKITKTLYPLHPPNAKPKNQSRTLE
jgi:hypothetical protein